MACWHQVFQLVGQHPALGGRPWRHARVAAYISAEGLACILCSHPCLWCGTNGPNDFEEEVSDDEDRAWAIRDDLALAMVNKCVSTELSRKVPGAGMMVSVPAQYDWQAYRPPSAARGRTVPPKGTGPEISIWGRVGRDGGRLRCGTCALALQAPPCSALCCLHDISTGAAIHSPPAGAGSCLHQQRLV